MFYSPVCLCQDLELLWLIRKNSYFLKHKSKGVFWWVCWGENSPWKGKKNSHKTRADKAWNHRFQNNLTPLFPCLSSYPTLWTYSLLGQQNWITGPHGLHVWADPIVTVWKVPQQLAFRHQTLPAFSLPLFLISPFQSPSVFFSSDIFRSEKTFIPLNSWAWTSFTRWTKDTINREAKWTENQAVILLERNVRSVHWRYLCYMI